MNAELKAKWIEALRSGKYRQATGTLRRGSADDSSFCCLGVLCDVSGEPWSCGPYGQWSIQGIGSTLPISVLEKFGMSPVDENPLIAMNDGDAERNQRKHSFAEIADYIEANL